MKNFVKTNLNACSELLRRGKARALAASAGLSVPVLAMAQSSDPFTTAMTDATTKVGTYAAALVGLAAVGVVFMIGAKYVKKIVRVA